jgi:RND family efflux transporter MFP subunit
MKNRLLLYILLIFSVFSCQSPQNRNTVTENQQTKTAPQTITVTIVKLSTFPLQMFSNGILHCGQKAELRFQSAGIIKDLKVTNGQRVLKGNIIAELENERQKIALAQAREQILSAEIELKSLLLSFGGQKDDTNSVPHELYQNLKIQSGYNKAQNQLKQAKLDYAHTVLKAPFTGVVAGLEAQPYNSVSPSNVFCNVLDNSSFIARFTLLESEIGKVHKGQALKIVPYADASIELAASITGINPMVDENGLVQVEAIAYPQDRGTTDKLYDGMNVKIIIENQVANQLIVPKQAVVLRSNKQVVFTYENGLAKWNYVKTAYENSTAYSIKEGLKENDTIIVQGNLNLAHDARVIIGE